MRYFAVLTLLGASLATASTLPPLTRAFNPAPFSSLQARQLPLSLDSFIPESCLETCAPTRATYESCVTDEDDNCEALCTQEEYDAFVDCQNCALQAVNRTYTEEEAEMLRENKKELEDVCTSMVARIDTKALIIPGAEESGAALGVRVKFGTISLGLVGTAIATLL